MSAMQPSDTFDDRVRSLGRTIRWAPAPTWGETSGEHVRFAGYLVGSMVAWTLAGLAIAGLLGRALGNIG
jgi:hypothetical protein